MLQPLPAQEWLADKCIPGSSCRIRWCQGSGNYSVAVRLLSKRFAMRQELNGVVYEPCVSDDCAKSMLYELDVDSCSGQPDSMHRLV